VAALDVDPQAMCGISTARNNKAPSCERGPPLSELTSFGCLAEIG
jgi:hypothetical protein